MEKKSIQFTMNYNALKLFGRQLYSNAWAAISELVANGFDANASNVYLYINMLDKGNSIIELLDNGNGMTETDIEKKYAVIGRNRRANNPTDTAAGRKGIGKLAALYLSDCYQVISKTLAGINGWSVDVTNTDEEARPILEYLNVDDATIECDSIWNSDKILTGTMIRLQNVNLNRLGEAAIDALKHKLSNYFLLDNMEHKLKVCFIQNINDKLTFDKLADKEFAFKELHKEIAFDNMITVYTDNSALIKTTKLYLSLSYQNKLGETKIYSKRIALNSFQKEITDPKTHKTVELSGNVTIDGVTKYYTLTGWVGIHSTIDKVEALNNDSRYIKNQFYNPNQIRVYVRGKLANDNILSKLPLVGAFVNYIEGEVSFEILDDNDFDDIATSNRQDFSIIDERVNILSILLTGICRQLLSDRQKLADDINRVKEEENKNIQSKEKTIFSREIYDDLIKTENISVEKANEWATVFANKLEGKFNYDLKKSFKLFLSHAGKDRIFTDFISAYLQHIGFIFDKEDVNKTEIFYSSDGTNIDNLSPLSEIIRKMIMTDNTQILFLTSANFLRSQYCLFEGGATWATRSIGEYGIIALDYDSIPKFLTNGKSEFSFNIEVKDSFMLNKTSYENLVKILNRAIEHLNKNREIKRQHTIPLISAVVFKDEVEAKGEGKTERDYMNQDVLSYWQTYVESKIEYYIKSNTIDNKSTAT